MFPKPCHVVCAASIFITPSSAQDSGNEKRLRVIKRTAMIERGREIIMEEVVFHDPSEQSPVDRAEEKKSLVLLKDHDSVQLPVVSSQASFTVNPVLYPNGLSLVTWWANQSDGRPIKHQCWSNLSWPVLGLGINFTADEIQYSAMFLTSSATLRTGVADEKSFPLPPASLRAFPEMVPSFHFVSFDRAARYQPNPAAIRFIRDLHEHFSRNHRNLERGHEALKHDSQQKELKRIAEKQQSKDFVIRFGLRQAKESQNTAKSTR